MEIREERVWSSLFETCHNHKVVTDGDVRAESYWFGLTAFLISVVTPDDSPDLAVREFGHLGKLRRVDEDGCAFCVGQHWGSSAQWVSFL